MDRINKYEQIIVNTLKGYANLWNNSGDSTIKSLPIIDSTGKHFQVLRYGWKSEENYIHYCVFHIDIIDDKVWIQENKTDILIAEELVNEGIDKKDIVLGLLPPSLRKDSDYAAA